jgi:microcystin-dependent protein
MSNQQAITLGQVPMGTIVPFILDASYLPNNWLMCNGTAIPTQYAALIGAIGANTPNLCGRTLIGTGQPSNQVQSDGTAPNFNPSNNWPVGYTGGEFVHELTINELPEHAHEYVESGFWGGGDCQSNSYNSYGNNSNTSATAAVGDNLPHNNMQPYYAVNYIIFAGS